MDVRTLWFALALVSAGVAALSGGLALLRPKKANAALFSGFCSFAAAAAFGWAFPSSALPDGAAGAGACFPVLAGDALAAVGQLLLATSSRLLERQKRAWPPRFLAYLCAFAVGEAASLSLGFPFARVAGLCVASVAAAAETIFASRPRKSNASRALRASGLALGAAWATTLVLISILILFPGSRRAAREAAPAATIVFIVLWSGYLFTTESASALRDVLKRNAALSELAGRDRLTGLWNRRHMDFSLKMEADRSDRYGHALSLILFDLDLFKDVNDAWGHAVGDEVLKRVSGIARGLVRESDGVFRWGGEEFAVIAPNTALEGAASLAEKMRAGIEASDAPPAGRVTASFGVAEFRKGESIEDWFERADRALYRAKKGGRNKVVAPETRGSLPIASLKLSWKEEWSSGDGEIDAEHKRLISLAGGLINASLAFAGPEELSSGLAELLGAAKAHFAHEEEILSRLGYPDLAGHAGIHADLIARAESLLVRNAEAPGSPGTYFDFLVDKVVIGHMLRDDSVFFPYLRSRTRSPSRVG